MKMRISVRDAVMREMELSESRLDAVIRSAQNELAKLQRRIQRHMDTDEEQFNARFQSKPKRRALSAQEGD